MLFNILPVIIFFVCFVIIIGLALRRLPDIATIKVDTIAEAKAAATKRQLLIERLRRKAVSVISQFWKATLHSRLVIKAWLIKFGKLLTELEKTYRPRRLSSTAGLDPVSEMLRQADKLRQAEAYKDAEKIYLEVIRNDHRNANAYLGLGLMYEAMEDHGQAKQSLEYASRLDRDNPQIFIALARVAEEQGRYSEARSAWAEVIALEPQVAEHRVALGDAAIMDKDFNSAKMSFQSAVELEPLNPRYLDRLLEACILAEDKNMAVEALRRLSEVNPENQKLVEFRQRVAVLSRRSRKKQAAPEQ